MKILTSRTQRRGLVVSFSSPNTAHASANDNSVKTSSFVQWRNQMTESEQWKQILQLNGNTACTACTACMHERSSWANRVLVWLWSELAADPRQIWGEPVQQRDMDAHRNSRNQQEPDSTERTCCIVTQIQSHDAALKVYIGHKLHLPQCTSTFASRELTAKRFQRFHVRKYRFFQISAFFFFNIGNMNK